MDFSANANQHLTDIGKDVLMDAASQMLFSHETFQCYPFES